MKRFHFKNNPELDMQLLKLYKAFNCKTLTDFINRVLFSNQREFLIFIDYYCCNNIEFEKIDRCIKNRKVSIPEAVYNSIKLCHKELDTYSMALIWRSFLINVVDCFLKGGRENWENYKRSLIETVEIDEENSRSMNVTFMSEAQSVHISNMIPKNISKIVFFSISNVFLGYLRY